MVSEEVAKIAAEDKCFRGNADAASSEENAKTH
jgi:hypothetical protein